MSTSTGGYEPLQARRRASRAAATRRRRAAFATVAALIGAVCIVVLAFGGSDTDGARVLHYTINSPLVHASLPQTAVIPPSGPSSGRAPLVFLHGKGENAESNLPSGLYAELRRLGSTAPDVVFPYGGENSYWRDRAGAAWGEYVMREVIPEAVRRLHADPARVAIGWLSMGGFGSYDLALAQPGRFCAVGGDSAASWRSGGESARARCTVPKTWNETT
jgi:S-formylglutathione hydrolase FrmB